MTTKKVKKTKKVEKEAPQERPIDETNFREHAQRAIKKYGEKGMILDAMVWGRIVGLYEDALKRRTAAL